MKKTMIVALLAFVVFGLYPVKAEKNPIRSTLSISTGAVFDSFSGLESALTTKGFAATTVPLAAGAVKIEFVKILPVYKGLLKVKWQHKIAGSALYSWNGTGWGYTGVLNVKVMEKSPYFNDWAPVPQTAESMVSINDTIKSYTIVPLPTTVSTPAKKP